MKILLIADSVSPFSSSGRVVHKISNALSLNNIENMILFNGEKDENTKLNVKYIKSGTIFDTKLHQILPNNLTNETIAFINEYKPTIVHFLSFNYSRSKYILNYLYCKKIKVILQPWIHDFYCAQMFGFRNGHECKACSKGNFLNALKYNCSPISTGLLSAVNRQFLKKAALNADIFISSNSYMDVILEDYGVNRGKIKRMPIPFEKSVLENKAINKKDNNSFIFYGQAKDFKGFYLMKDIALKCPQIKFKLCPIGNKFDVNYFAECKNIEVITTFSASNGLFEEINNSIGVILPTLWPTTTEYSLYEAMYLAKAVVAFNVGVHKDILINRKNALLSDLGNIDDFVNNIIELAENKVLREEIGNNARDLVNKIADENLFFSQLLSIYTC